jgi:hypothetical protein
MAAYGGKIGGMMIEAKMSAEEFNGLLKRYRLNYADVSSLIYMKTGAVIDPKHVRTQLERYGFLSGTMTAVFRLLFKLLDAVHEKSV